MRLTNREKLLAVCLVLFLIAWLLYAFFISPSLARAETLSRVIPQKQDELRQLRSKSARFIAIRDRLNSLRAKMASQEGVELLPFLESQIRSSNLENKVASMKQNLIQPESGYSETIVELNLQNVTLKELIALLRNVQSSNVLASVKTLYIKKSLENEDLLNSTIEIRNIKLLKD
ncbi:MAG: type II secretion system protein M [Planctomycetota bacterium]|nr:MAG: type II secretion system protein M [Planctomycetota bacterium]